MISDSGDTKTINSVENAVRILDELLSRERAGVTELGEAVGLSKSTVHHYLATLERHDFVHRVDGEYALGLRPLSYGGVAREREAMFRVGKEGVDRLAADTGETARLVIERKGYAITLYQASEGRHEDIPTTLGTREDLHSTAAGKAMLAEMADEAVEAYLKREPLTRHTKNTIVNADALWSALADVRSRGVAFDDEEQFEGIRCVAIALVADTGDLLGALSVSGPTTGLAEEAVTNEYPQILRNVAGVIEINTAYRGWID